MKIRVSTHVYFQYACITCVFIVFVVIYVSHLYASDKVREPYLYLYKGDYSPE